MIALYRTGSVNIDPIRTKKVSLTLPVAYQVTDNNTDSDENGIVLNNRLTTNCGMVTTSNLLHNERFVPPIVFLMNVTFDLPKNQII